MQARAGISLRSTAKFLARPHRFPKRGAPLAQQVQIGSNLQVRHAGRFEFLRNLMQPQQPAAKQQQDAVPAEPASGAQTAPIAEATAAPTNSGSESAAASEATTASSSTIADSPTAAASSEAESPAEAQVAAPYSIAASGAKRGKPRASVQPQSAEPDLSSLSLSHWRPSRGSSSERVVDLQSAQANRLLNTGSSRPPRDHAARPPRRSTSASASIFASAQQPRMRNAAADRADRPRSKRVQPSSFAIRDPEEDEHWQPQQRSHRQAASASPIAAAASAAPPLAVEDEHGVSSSSEFVTVSSRMLETLQAQNLALNQQLQQLKDAQIQTLTSRLQELEAHLARVASGSPVAPIAAAIPAAAAAAAVAAAPAAPIAPPADSSAAASTNATVVVPSPPAREQVPSAATATSPVVTINAADAVTPPAVAAAAVKADSASKVEVFKSSVPEMVAAAEDESKAIKLKPQQQKLKSAAPAAPAAPAPLKADAASKAAAAKAAPTEKFKSSVPEMVAAAEAEDDKSRKLSTNQQSRAPSSAASKQEPTAANAQADREKLRSDFHASLVKLNTGAASRDFVTQLQSLWTRFRAYDIPWPSDAGELATSLSAKISDAVQRRDFLQQVVEDMERHGLNVSRLPLLRAASECSLPVPGGALEKTLRESLLSEARRKMLSNALLQQLMKRLLARRDAVQAQLYLEEVAHMNRQRLAPSLVPHAVVAEGKQGSQPPRAPSPFEIKSKLHTPEHAAAAFSAAARPERFAFERAQYAELAELFFGHALYRPLYQLVLPHLDEAARNQYVNKLSAVKDLDPLTLSSVLADTAQNASDVLPLAVQSITALRLTVEESGPVQQVLDNVCSVLRSPKLAAPLAPELLLGLRGSALKHPEGARVVFELMTVPAVGPSFAQSLHTKNRQWLEEARSALFERASNGKEVSIAMVDLVLHGYAWAGLYHQVASLFIELHDVFGLTPSPRSYESLLVVASLARRYEELDKIAESLAASKPPVELTRQTQIVLGVHALRRNNLALALRMLGDAIKTGDEQFIRWISNEYVKFGLREKNREIVDKVMQMVSSWSPQFAANSLPSAQPGASTSDILHDSSFAEGGDGKAQTAAASPAIDNRPSFTTGAQSILSVEQLAELRKRLGVVLTKAPVVPSAPSVATA